MIYSSHTNYPVIQKSSSNIFLDLVPWSYKTWYDFDSSSGNSSNQSLFNDNFHMKEIRNKVALTDLETLDT